MTKPLTKAKQEAVQALFNMAWNHEAREMDVPQQHRLAAFAHEHEMLHLLPDAAHSTLHDVGIPHRHEGMDEDHVHTVTKAYNPIAKQWEISKAWSQDGASDCFIEGWLSTPDIDLEQDIVEPEAFLNSMDSYFQRRAPISYIHERKTLPAGHLQKAAVVRDGNVVKAVTHPTDAADFEHFPRSGTGVYVRAILNQPEVADAVRKGNVGGFSFIGNGKEYSPRTPKGHHYTAIDPWIESTVAPYPINHNAVITVAKAYGLEPEEDTTQAMTNQDILDKLEQLLTQSEPTQAEPVAQKGVTEDRLVELLSGFRSDIEKAVDTKVQKAIELVREEGTGSKVTLIKAVLPDENPASALVKKAQAGEEWSADESRLAHMITHSILTAGMNGSSSDDVRFL